MIHRAPPELHLPDLPEIAVQLGLPGDGGAPGAPARLASPWGYRLRQGLSSYMPLLLNETT